MRKRIVLLLILVLCITTTMAGCNLFERDLEAYYSEVIVRIDDDITIDKEDLLNGYSNYGSTLVSQYSYTPADALDQTINLLINREILLREAKKTELTEKETSYCWRKTYEALNSALAEYETEIKVEWEITSDAPAAATPERTTKTAFERTAYPRMLADGTIEIVVDEEEDEYANETIITGGAENFKQDVSNQKVATEAMRRYIKALKKSEEGRKYDSSTDEAVFKRAVDRVYENQVESLYIAKIEKNLAKNANISAYQIAQKYKEMLLADYTKYMLSPSTYNTNMIDTNSNSTIYYYPNEQEHDEQEHDEQEHEHEEFFYVSHLLVKFNTEQQAIVDDLKTKMNEGYISEYEYNTQLSDIANQIETYKYVDGDKTDEKLGINELLTRLNSELSGKSVQEKFEVFDDYLYAFNEDPGVVNATVPYVIGVETSKMVDSFNEAARALNQANEMAKISGLVPSSYGVHILIYCGKAQNLATITDADTFDVDTSIVMQMAEKRLNPLNEKTIFDVVYESLVKDNSSINESIYVRSLKQGATINVYKQAYKDLLS